MFNWFKKTKHSKPIYNFVEIDSSDLDQFPNGIGDLYNRKVDGFLIRGVLSKDEVDRLLRNYAKVKPEEIDHPNPGLQMFPKAFSQLDQGSRQSTELLQNYFLENVSFWKNFPQRFEMDFEAVVKKTLERIGGGRKANKPDGENGVGAYTPATIKKMIPVEGHLVPHCGNLFHKEFPTFFGHLQEFSIVSDQLSYFVMLAAPAEGGELVLYDVEWKDAQIRLEDKTTLEGINGKKYDLENERKVKRQLVNPGPGDMIVFAGGNIWHRVAFVGGNASRITMGGFLSRSKDDKTVYFWS